MNQRSAHQSFPTFIETRSFSCYNLCKYSIKVRFVRCDKLTQVQLWKKREFHQVVQEFREADQQTLRSVCAQTNAAAPNWKREFSADHPADSPASTSSKCGHNQQQLKSIYSKAVGGEASPSSLCQNRERVITHG